MKSKIILIAGGTASGKTYIAKRVSEELKKTGKNVTFISIDNYYKTVEEFDGLPSEKINWDHPKAIKWNELKDDIKKLMNGEHVVRNVYDFSKSMYGSETIKIEPTEYIILEGLYALYDDEIVSNAEAKFFVETDPDVRVIRRIKRDQTKRMTNFNIDVFLDQWQNSIKPMHDKFVAPQKNKASIVFKNNLKDGEGDTEAISMITNLLT